MGTGTGSEVVEISRAENLDQVTTRDGRQNVIDEATLKELPQGEAKLATLQTREAVQKQRLSAIEDTANSREPQSEPPDATRTEQNADQVLSVSESIVAPIGFASYNYVEKVLVSSDASRVSFYLSAPYTRQRVISPIQLDKFTEEFSMEAKRDIPDRFRKFTLLLFEPAQHFTIEEFWLHFAQKIELRTDKHQDAIVVCSWPDRPQSFIVAYQKRDQRQVRIPEGFRERYVQAMVKRGATRHTEIDILSKLSCLGVEQVSNLLPKNLKATPSAIEVVNAVQNLTPQELAMSRVEAALIPAKNRKPFERMLTSEWQITKNALAQTREPRTQAIYASKVQETGAVQPEKVFKPSWKKLRVTIHDISLLTPLMPRVGGATSNIVTLETFLKFKELHQNVTLFIPGLPRKGKSELAKFLCLLLAFTYQNGDPYFLMTNTLDALRASQPLLLPGVPVLLDDIGGDEDDAQLIYSTVSMWKAILQIKDPAQIRGRSDDIMWAARQPKVISSNCKDLVDWIDTMFPGSKQHHKEAIPPRVAECEPVLESLYSGAVAQDGSQHFLEMHRNSQEAAAAIQDLFD